MPETPKQAAEAAAIRRRWITLGEILAVIAVLISGLTFWNSYSERSSAEAERAAEKQARTAEAKEKEAKAQTLLLKASGGGDALQLAPLDRAQAIQSQTIAFPRALKVKAVDTVIDPRIEAGWIEAAALKAAKRASGGSGDRRLPVAITTRFVSGGGTFSDTAIYDIGYRIERGLLDTDVELLGLALVERSGPEAVQARLDTLWENREKK